MSDQSPSPCDHKRIARERSRFLCYGALSIALAVGFGYSMAAMRYQGAFAAIAEVGSKERTSLHNRYMRQLGKRDREINELIRICQPGVEPR